MRHWPSITSCLKYASQKVLRAGSHLWLLLCLSTLNPWDWWLMPCQTNTLKYLPKFFYFGPIPAASDTSYHHFMVASRSLNWQGNYSCWDRMLFILGRAFYFLSFSALISIKKRMKGRESRREFLPLFVFLFFPFWFQISWICKHFKQYNDEIKDSDSAMIYSL